MTAPVGLSRAIGESLYRSATLPLRFVLWFPRVVLAIVIPACVFAAVLHYFHGEVDRIPLEIAYLAGCSVVLGVLRWLRARFAI